VANINRGISKYEQSLVNLNSNKNSPFGYMPIGQRERMCYEFIVKQNNQTFEQSNIQTI